MDSKTNKTEWTLVNTVLYTSKLHWLIWLCYMLSLTKI